MKKLSISILLLFVMILSITAVAAADDVTSDLAKSQIADDSAVLAVDGNTDVLAGTTGGNFTQFQKDIDASASPTITKDYTMVTGEKAVVISKEVRIVGSTIDANGSGTIFNITSTGKLYLTGVVLKNGNATNGGAIYNDGEIIIQNGDIANAFNTNNATLGGAIYNNGIITFEGNAAFTGDTGKTGADIYNAKTGTITIAKDSTFAGSIYNEGTMTVGASTFNGEFVNNGTIDSIVAAKLNGAVTNLGTITTLNTNNIAADITNNGTITTIKGKTTGKITNNGNIGTINATLADLENNGTITTITAVNAANIVNKAKATIETIDNVTLTGKLSTQGAIATVKNSKFDGLLEILTNGSIGTINNVTAYAFDTYGSTGSIINSAFPVYFWCENENVTIGTINNVSTDGKLHIDGKVTSILNSKLNERIEVNAKGSIDTIDNVTALALDNYGTIGEIYDSIFTSYIWNENENATIDTLDNVTTDGKIYNGGSIDEIYDVRASSLDNPGEIGAVIYANITGAVTNDGNITEIDDSIFGSTFTNNGNIFLGIENLTVAGAFTNKGNINDIYDVIFAKAVTNDGNISYIDNATFKDAVTNNGNFTYIVDSTFNGTITNDGVMYIDDATMTTKVTIVNKAKAILGIYETTFANFTNTVITNSGNLGVFYSEFNNVTGTYYNAIIVNYANLTVAYTEFNSNKVRCIDNAANLTVGASVFDNNTADCDIVSANAGSTVAVAKVINSTFIKASGVAIDNRNNLTLSGNTINTTSAQIKNSATGFITAVKLTVTNKDTVYNYAAPVNLTATLTDVDGNWIYDANAFNFVINGTAIDGTLAYNATTGVYSLETTLKGKSNITNVDQTVTAKLAAKYVNATADVTNGTLKTIKGTFTELQYLINTTAASGTLVLPYNFAYNAEFDNVNLTKGVVINQPITIEGNGTTIDGKGVARILFINTNEYRVNLNNITFTNGNAEYGGAIYVNDTENIYGPKITASKFVNNVATVGGAIYLNNTITDITDSTFINNTNNGAPNAIFANGGRLYINNNTINKQVAEVVLYNSSLFSVKLNITVLGNKTINATYHDAVVLNATITDDKGNLIEDPAFVFTIDNKEVKALYSNGIYTANYVLDLVAGKLYEVSVVYNRTGVTNNPTIAKGAYNLSKENGTITIDARDVEMGKNATIFFEAFGDNGDNLNGTNITVSVNDVAYNVTITNGTGNLTLPVLDLGTYRVYANYAGDANHSAMSQVVEFGVKIPTVMTVTATDITYDSALIKITLQSKGGDKLEGFVTLLVGDNAYRLPVQNGVGSQAVTGLKPGVYTATAQFFDDAQYADATASTTFTIEAATVIADNIKRGVNSPFDYYVTVKDGNGNPIANKEVTIYVNGTKYTPKTNASGIATVAAGLTVVNETATVYDVIVVNPDTGANITATTTIVPRIVVLSGDLTADYLENPPYVVQAFGDDGNPVGEGEIVTVVFSGYFYYMPTNATGHVVRTIGLAPGLYAVKAGYKDYNASATIFSVKQILTASSGVLKKSAKSYTLKATLKSTNGKPLAGKEVKLTFNGKTYTVKTNAKGIASYKISSSVISKLSAGKTYKLTAKYVNDLTKGKYVGKIVVKK